MLHPRLYACSFHRIRGKKRRAEGRSVEFHPRERERDLNTFLCSSQKLLRCTTPSVRESPQNKYPVRGHLTTTSTTLPHPSFIQNQSYCNQVLRLDLPTQTKLRSGQGFLAHESFTSRSKNASRTNEYQSIH